LFTFFIPSPRHAFNFAPTGRRCARPAFAY